MHVLRIGFLLALAACPPSGIRYPNPQDGGEAEDAASPMDGGGPDAAPFPDAAETGALVLRSDDGDLLEGAALDFGLVVVGSTRTITLVLENGTNAPVSLVGAPLVDVSGNDGTSFSAVQPVAAYLPPGARTELGASAHPVRGGPVEVRLSIPHDGGSYDIVLRSTGRVAGLFAGVGGGGLRAISTDGRFWTNEATFPGSDDSNLFRTVAFGDGVLVAGGGGQNGLIHWSDDGITWNDVGDALGWIGGIAYGNGMFVGVGANGRILLSGNGRSFSDGGIDFREPLRAIAFGNGRFVAVGDQGRRKSTTDGMSWTPDVYGGDRLTGICHLSDRFIAVGLSGRRTVSLDGETWMFEDERGLGLFDVACGNGVAVGVGGIGVTVSSDGGMSWVDHPGGPLMNSIAFGRGMFVGTGDIGGIAFTSPDGVTWTRHDMAGAAGFTKIVFADGL
jgi:hypothetical protein